MASKEQYNNNYVYKAIKSSIYELSNAKDNSYVKAQLANLRNSIGKQSGGYTDVWPILIKNIPDEYIGRSAELTAGEQAILHTLQLYALYNQGNSDNLTKVEKETSWTNMGTSFSEFRNQNSSTDKIAIDRRFNMMITSETYGEFLYHLRQMVRLMKTKRKGQIYVDFPKLGQDLFAFIKGREDAIRISWSREYYRVRSANEENNKGEENEQ